MRSSQTILILSDIHYAGAAERQRGSAELELIRNPVLRLIVRVYRNVIWRRDPFAYNHLLSEFLNEVDNADYVVANGDYSCDTAFVGVSDDPCFESVQECLTQLRALGPRLKLVFGDHELGKFSLVGSRGGLRLASWFRAQEELGIDPFWTLRIGRYLLMGVTSSVVGFPVFEPEALPEEREGWYKIRAAHMAFIGQALQPLDPDDRLILFCHDPTALPFLARHPEMQRRMCQIEATIIGHLHSELFLWKSRLLAGMPTITFMGNAIRRMSSALHEAKLWRPFKVRLCPALGGIDLLKDGGFYRMHLDPSGETPLRFEFRRLGHGPPGAEAKKS